MICPLKMVSMPRAIEPGDEELLKCEETGCAWWVPYLGERACAIKALAELARVTYENQGK